MVTTGRYSSHGGASRHLKHQVGAPTAPTPPYASVRRPGAGRPRRRRRSRPPPPPPQFRCRRRPAPATRSGRRGCHRGCPRRRPHVRVPALPRYLRRGRPHPDHPPSDRRRRPLPARGVCPLLDTGAPLRPTAAGGHDHREYRRVRSGPSYVRTSEAPPPPPPRNCLTRHR